MIMHWLPALVFPLLAVLFISAVAALPRPCLIVVFSSLLVPLTIAFGLRADWRDPLSYGAWAVSLLLASTGMLRFLGAPTATHKRSPRLALQSVRPELDANQRRLAWLALVPALAAAVPLGYGGVSIILANTRTEQAFDQAATNPMPDNAVVAILALLQTATLEAKPVLRARFAQWFKKVEAVDARLHWGEWLVALILLQERQDLLTLLASGPDAIPDLPARVNRKLREFAQARDNAALEQIRQQIPSNPRRAAELLCAWRKGPAYTLSPAAEGAAADIAMALLDAELRARLANFVTTVTRRNFAHWYAYDQPFLLGKEQVGLATFTARRRAWLNEHAALDLRGCDANLPVVTLLGCGDKLGLTLPCTGDRRVKFELCRAADKERWYPCAEFTRGE